MECRPIYTSTTIAYLRTIAQRNKAPLSSHHDKFYCLRNLYDHASHTCLPSAYRGSLRVSPTFIPAPRSTHYHHHPPSSLIPLLLPSASRLPLRSPHPRQEGSPCGRTVYAILPPPPQSTAYLEESRGKRRKTKETNEEPRRAQGRAVLPEGHPPIAGGRNVEPATINVPLVHDRLAIALIGAEPHLPSSRRGPWRTHSRGRGVLGCLMTADRGSRGDW